MSTRSDIPGWHPEPPIPGGHEGVMRCGEPLCGAFVRTRVDQERHDREFHATGKPDSIRAWDLRLALTLLAADGDVRDDAGCRLDHHGDCQMHGHADFDPALGCPTIRARALVAKYAITDEEIEAL